MKNKLQLLALLCLAAPASYAQTAAKDSTLVQSDDEFTVTESQLGEDEDMTSDIIQVGSANNIYASQPSHLQIHQQSSSSFHQSSHDGGRGTNSKWRGSARRAVAAVLRDGGG